MTLFSSLLALSVNTIPEEEIDYIFDSSSDEEITINLPSSSESASEKGAEDNPSEGFIIDPELDLDLVLSNKTSLGVQANVSTKEVGAQTQLSEYAKVIYGNLDANLKSKADLLEFGLENANPINSKELVEKAVQTKPNFHIDLSSIPIKEEFTVQSIFRQWPKNMDPLMMEIKNPNSDLNFSALGDMFSLLI